jgi:hypothetical protein
MIGGDRGKINVYSLSPTEKKVMFQIVHAIGIPKMNAEIVKGACKPRNEQGLSTTPKLKVYV